MRADPPQPNSGPPPSYTTSSDIEGKFSLKDIEPGRYRLRVMRNGFVSTEYGSRGPMRSGTMLTLERGGNLKDIAFRLTPHGVIAGRIVDADGDPVANASVQIVRTAYVQGRKQLMPMNGVSTNDLGEYRLFGIAPGKYFLTTTWRGMNMNMMFNAIERSATPQPDEDYVPTYFPGTTDPSAAVQVEVAAGATSSNINWKLAKARTVRVRGRVSQNVVQGRPNLMVRLQPRSSNFPSLMMGGMNTRPPDPKGNFEITGVAPGSYTVHAMIYAQDKSYSASVPVEVGSSHLENVNLEITGGFTVTGTLHVDGDTTEKLANLMMRLAPREQAMAMASNQVKLNPDGSFRIDDVSAGRYNFTAYNLPEGFYVKSVRAGETDVLLSGYDATGGRPGPLAVVISAKAGQVTGLVQNPATQKPAVGATVVLIPQEPERRSEFSFYKQISADQHGNFVIKSVAPGEYKVFAWEDLEPGIYMDPEFVKPIESMGEAVSVKESGGPSVQLKLIPADAPQR